MLVVSNKREPKKAMIVVGICLSAISISLIIYMKNRLGLNPDDYDKDEIYNKGDVEVKL